MSLWFGAVSDGVLVPGLLRVVGLPATGGKYVLVAFVPRTQDNLASMGLEGGGGGGGGVGIYNRGRVGGEVYTMIYNDGEGNDLARTRCTPTSSFSTLASLSIRMSSCTSKLKRGPGVCKIACYLRTTDTHLLAFIII